MQGKDKVKTLPTETWHYDDISGLPPTFVYSTSELPESEAIYWTKDGKDLKGMKMGVLYDHLKDDQRLKILNKMIPSKKLVKKNKCYFAVSQNQSNHDQGQFERNGNVVYASTAYTGFKFMP